MGEGKTKNPLRNIVKSVIKYKGHILDLCVDTVKFPSGVEKEREVVLHSSAVAILPVNEKGEILLVKQYRHAVDEEILEIPAGLVERGENPRDAAMRELQEEIGYKPDHLEEIAQFYSSPGFCTERIIVYYAWDLMHSKLPEDDDEFIKVKAFAPEELDKLVAARQIKDGKTLMAYFWYIARRQRQRK